MFRLDLATEDSEATSKYVVSCQSQFLLKNWSANVRLASLSAHQPAAAKMRAVSAAAGQPDEISSVVQASAAVIAVRAVLPHAACRRHAGQWPAFPGSQHHLRPHIRCTCPMAAITEKCYTSAGPRYEG